jgi:hypothetical protein
MAGPEPLSWSDIASWAGLMGIRLAEWEVQALRAMDCEFLSEVNKAHG